MQSLSEIGPKISRKKAKISLVTGEVSHLASAIQSSKAQRDLHIGQNFIKNQGKIDKKLTENKTSLENILIRVKQDCGKLSEDVQEQEDMIQFLISHCRSYDHEIGALKKELERIKILNLPVSQNSKVEDLNNSFSLSSSFTMNQPIQLNLNKKLNKRSESLGGFK